MTNTIVTETTSTASQMSHDSVSHPLPMANAVPLQKPLLEKSTLLIVDDEVSVREALRLSFKDKYQCILVSRGRDALDYAAKNSVDVSILDVNLPDLSGVDILKELKAKDPHIECIILTGMETIEDARAAVRFGAADYVHKPFDAFELRTVLEKCIARRKSWLDSESALVALEKLKDELTRELAESNRAVTAGVLSAGVVHEMNNPLSIIAGYSQLLSIDLERIKNGDSASTQQVQAKLSTIQHEILRCKEIAKRFLNFSRAAQPTMELVEVRKIVEDAVALIKAHPGNRGAQINISSIDPSLRVRVHAGEILQVLINLGVNALESMGGKGDLLLVVERIISIPVKGVYRSEWFDPRRPSVKISIVDSGNGIPDDQISKLIQPYFSTKQQGTGLGLAIACELISHHAGMLDIETSVGKGSTFTVYLPQDS